MKGKEEKIMTGSNHKNMGENGLFFVVARSYFDDTTAEKIRTSRYKQVSGNGNTDDVTIRSLRIVRIPCFFNVSVSSTCLKSIKKQDRF